MKLNGSLIFDASSASEIKNLRLQKVPALPGIVDADVGRLVYHSTTGIIYVGAAAAGTGALSWVPLATGGDASALLAEVDRIETSLGLNSDGSFNAGAIHTDFAAQTSYAGVIDQLRGMAAAASAAAAAEATRATAAEVALGNRITTELATAATNTTGAIADLETALRTDLDDEVDRATAAETALGTRITDELADAVTARDTAIAAAVAAEATIARAAEVALGGRIDTEAAARIAGDDANATAISTERTRAIGAEALLDGRITTEVADRTAAVATVAAGLATEISDRTAAITAVTTAIGNEVTRATAQEAAIRGELASALVGLTWEAPVDLIAADATTADLTGLADGYRIVDLATNAVFTVTGGALGAPEALADGAAFFNRTNDIGYTFNGTAVVPFSGAASFVAGAGLSMTGNTVNVGTVDGDGSIVVEADGIRVSDAVRTEITDNADAIAAEVTRATGVEGGINQRIDDEIAAREAADTAAEVALVAEVADRKADVNEEEARAIGVEDALGVRIDGVETLVTDLTGPEGAIAVAVDGERTRAIDAEEALGDLIAAETANRAAADTAAVTARDGAITAAVGAETTARNTAITGINTRIGKMYYLYEGDEGAAAPQAATHTVTHNIGQRYCNVTVVDDTDNVVIPESIVFTSENALTVSFNSPIACRVICMGLAAS